MEKFKQIGMYLVPSLLLLWFPARFYWDVFHYYTHFEDLLIVLMGFATIIFCAVSMVQAFKRRNWAYMALVTAALLSCLFFEYWIRLTKMSIALHYEQENQQMEKQRMHIL